MTVYKEKRIPPPFTWFNLPFHKYPLVKVFVCLQCETKLHQMSFTLS